MKTVKKGDVINFKGFVVKIIETGVDFENGKEIATLSPTEFKSIPLDIYLEDYGMKLEKK